MAGFLSDYCSRQIGPHLYVLTRPLQYACAVTRSIISVPDGFQTDEESCPAWLPIINSLFGDVADQPAVVHDWLYFSAIYDRATADKVLLEAMGTIPGLSAWRRKGIYYGLRLLGWKAWNDHRKAGDSLQSFYSRNKLT